MLRQNGLNLTRCCGLSSLCRPGSVAGLPMTNSPPSIGTMTKLTFALNYVGVNFHPGFTRLLAGGDNSSVNIVYQCEFLCPARILRFLTPPCWSSGGVE